MDLLKQHCLFPVLVLKKLAGCMLAGQKGRPTPSTLVEWEEFFWISLPNHGIGLHRPALVNASIPLGITLDLFQTWVLPRYASMWARV